MILIVMPAIDGLKHEWSEAAETLGATRWQFWRYVGLPVLWPNILGTLALLFANSFGAIATAYALTGSSLNIVPILLYAQIRGDVLHNENLGAALALGMVVITGARQSRLHRLPHPRRTVAEMKRSRLGRLARLHARRALFPAAADRDLRVLAAHPARHLFLRRLRQCARPTRCSARPSPIRW